MKAVNAIYENGMVHFQFHHPEYLGPVPVMVVFPYEEEDHRHKTNPCNEEGSWEPENDIPM